MKTNIASERVKMGLSQEQLANKLGVTRETVKNWEIERTIPGVDSAVELADLFGCTIDYLLARTEQRTGVSVTITSGPIISAL